MEYLLCEPLTKMPPCKPYPPEVGFISTIILSPQSEHLPFIVIVDFSGLASNIFFRTSIIDSYLHLLLTIGDLRRDLAKSRHEGTGLET